MWVILAIRKQEFALPAMQVREILAMPDVTVVPMGRPEDRGVINLRGQVIRLIDMRKLFGWQSVPEELDAFYKLMGQREEDHRNWLSELERSVTEGTEFRLGTDPRRCAFGQWYYSYRPESAWVGALLRKFESPHNRIHTLASAVHGLTRSGRRDEAQSLIDSKRNSELKQMVALFQELKDLMRQTAKELAVVITAAQRTFAISVDHAVAVEAIAAGMIKELNIQEHGFVRQVAERTAAKSLALILDPELVGVG